MTHRILLKYSTEKADEPIISYVIKETDSPINILHADLTPEGGEIFIEIDGTDEEINRVIDLFEEKGVETEKVERSIRLDKEACVHCGACVSICPTDALTLSDDYELILDEEECVYCKACIPACPVKALSVKKF